MLSSIRHLDYVVLFCDDLDRMRDFYRDVMGFTVQLDTGRWVELRVGSVLLALAVRRAVAGSGPGPDPGAEPGAGEKGPAVQLAFRVPPGDVERCHEELVASGVPITQPPRILDSSLWRYWRHRTLFFTDPEGNLLEIYAEIDLPDEIDQAGAAPVDGGSGDAGG